MIEELRGAVTKAIRPFTPPGTCGTQTWCD